MTPPSLFVILQTTSRNRQARAPGVSARTHAHSAFVSPSLCPFKLTQSHARTHTCWRRRGRKRRRGDNGGSRGALTHPVSRKKTRRELPALHSFKVRTFTEMKILARLLSGGKCTMHASVEVVHWVWMWSSSGLIGVNGWWVVTGCC